MSLTLKYSMKKRAKKSKDFQEMASPKGVHNDLGQSSGNSDSLGKSSAGHFARQYKEHGNPDDLDTAKAIHEMKLTEIRRSEKPDLMAEGGEADEEKDTRGPHPSAVAKGVHRPFGGRGNSVMGHAAKGHWSYGDDKRNSAYARKEHERVLGEMKSMPKPKLYAEGGEMKNPKERAMEAFAKGGEAHVEREKYIKGVHVTNHEGEGNSAAGSFSKSAVKGNTSLSKGDLNHAAREEHSRILSEQKALAMKKPNLYAEGGQVHHDPNKGWSQKDKEDFSKGAGGSPQPQPKSQPDPFMTSMAHGGRVDRIMKKRHMMSEGGVIANDLGEGEAADEMPNEFDDLVLDDHLSMHETGADAGDELGNAQEEHDEHDIVSRIMKSRAKKDCNPRPA